MIRRLQDMIVDEKTVFVRLDCNVPLDGTRVRNTNRLQGALPTIQWLLEKNAKIILASHLGRPHGQEDLSLSLEPVAHALAELLDQEIVLADNCIGDGVELLIKGLRPKQILMLENLRFHPEEEDCNAAFASKLSRFSSVYVLDAFGAAHRKHASTYALASLYEQRCMGMLVAKEVDMMDQLLSPTHPFVAMLGGSKVADKIGSIEALLKRADCLLIGGAMAHAFHAAQGQSPAGPAARSDIDCARKILQVARARGTDIVTPIDMVDGFDIGPQTVALFQKRLDIAKLIFWNGPLGFFEKKPYDAGTQAIASFLSGRDNTIVGGGDTVAAVEGFDFKNLSTGGGAILEYLEHGSLPCIDVLKLHARERDNLKND